MTSEGSNQLQMVFEEYVKISNVDIENTINRNTSGDYRAALLVIGKVYNILNPTKGHYSLNHSQGGLILYLSYQYLYFLHNLWNCSFSEVGINSSIISQYEQGNVHKFQLIFGISMYFGS